VIHGSSPNVPCFWARAFLVVSAGCVPKMVIDMRVAKNVQKRVTPFVHVGHNKGLQPLVTAASELLLNVFGGKQLAHQIVDAPVSAGFEGVFANLKR
jgi:hypothetical protein